MVKRFTTRNNSGYPRGFTLIEVMVVIVLIGIILLFAIPNFASMQRRGRIRAGAEEVGQDFRDIRERALASGQAYYMVKDLSNKAYHLYLPSGALRTRELGAATGGALRLGTTNAGSGIPEDPDGMPGTFDFATGDTLWFQPRGAMSRGAVYLTNGKEDYAVGVTSLGMIRVYEYTDAGSWKKY